jgi:hypothetical protein
VDKPLLRRFDRRGCDPHQDVHQRRWRSDNPRQTLGAAATWQDSDIDLREPDLKIALLRDTNIARQRKLKPGSHRRTGDRRDNWLGICSARRIALAKLPGAYGVSSNHCDFYGSGKGRPHHPQSTITPDRDHELRQSVLTGV